MDKQKDKNRKTKEQGILNDKPLMTESTVKWAALARRYISLQDKDFLNQAVKAVKGPSAEEIRQILEHYADENFKINAEDIIKLLISQNRVEEGLTILLLGLSIDTRAVEQFRDFPLDEQKERFQSGLEACQQAIQVSEVLQDTLCKALFMTVMGNGFQAVKQFETAGKFYVDALRIYQEFATVDSHTYLPNLAMALNNVAVLQYNSNNFEETETFYTEALKLYRQLALSNSRTYLPRVSLTLNNLAILQKRLGKFKEARILYTEALKIDRKLAIDEPQTYLPHIAITLNNLANLQNNLNEFEKAETLYAEALEINRKLASDSSHTYLPKLAQTLHNLANSYWSRKKFDEAGKLYLEALQIRREMAANSQSYLPELAMTLNNLGIIQGELNDFKEAEKLHLETLEIRRSLTKNNPQAYLPDLSQTLANLGILQASLNKPEDAERFYIEALEIDQKLAADNPQVYLPNLARTLNNLANLYLSNDNFAAAEKLHFEALEIRRKLVAVNSQTYLPDLMITLNNLANLYWSKDHFEFTKAEFFNTEALEIIRRLVAVNPQVYSPNLALALSTRATQLYSKNRYEEAETAFLEAVEIYRKLTAINPQAYLLNLSKILNNIANLYGADNKYALAEKYYIEALRIRRKLAVVNSQNYLPDVATSLNNLGYLSIAKNNFKTALKYFSEAKEIVEVLLDELQDINRRKQLFQKYITIYRGLLSCYAGRKEWNKAIEIAEQGKSRSLNDHISLQTFHPQISPNESAENKTRFSQTFDKYVKTIKDSQITESLLSGYFQEMADIAGKDNSALLKKERLEKLRKHAEKRLFDLRTKRKNLLLKIRRFDPNYPALVENLTFEQILDISQDSKHAIVFFRVLFEATYIFVIFPDRNYKPFRISDFTSRDLDEIRHLAAAGLENLTIPESKPVSKREAAFEKDSDISNVIPDLMKKISENLIKPVRRQLEKKAVMDVVFVPNGSLAVLPLHACFDETRKRYLIEDFNIKFSTSVSLFKKAWENSRKCSETDKLMFVTNPRKDLKFAEQEVAGICRIYGLNYKNYQHNLIRQKATIKAVKEKLAQDFNIIHFACHGNYKSDEPFSSPLEMAKNRNLHLKEIMQMRLSRTRLVVLSACKTGMVNAQDISDEHYGFPFGFILSGASSVWGTLWSVDDKATSILMEKAYGYLKEGKEISVALRQSQIEMCREAEYSAPYYWASFQHFGF